VVLEFADDFVALTIADDGAGLSMTAMQPEGAEAGVGLRGMRQRLAGIGGTFEIGPRCGKGTIVSAVVPLVCDLQQGGTS
ncbi:sensor histidine kinase, partial [Streptomyces niveiscabiei]